MAYTILEDLKRGEELIEEGKLDEALNLVYKIEKKEELTPEMNLRCLYLKGVIFLYFGRFEEASKIAVKLNKAIQTSEVLELNNPTSLGKIVNEIFN